MHIPLIIAILAFLALLLLTAFDPNDSWEIHAKGMRAYGSRLGRWVTERARLRIHH